MSIEAAGLPRTALAAGTNARLWWSLGAPALVGFVCSLGFIARTAFVVNGDVYFTLFDDAMISMRYARNLAEGHGLVWNAGQAPVEGYTNFLWTLWMAALHLSPASESKISLLVMLSGALILVVNLSIMRLIAMRLAPGAPLAAALAVWLTALYYPLVYWTLRGMEVGLVTVTISASVLLALRLYDRFRYEELIALAVLMGLGMLTRPDVLIPCLVISVFVCLTARPEHRRIAALALGVAVAGTVGLHTVFRMIYYGAPVPNTYYLKVDGAALDARLYRGLRGLLGFGVFHLAVPFALAVSYLSARSRTARVHPGTYLLAALVLALCAYSAYVGGDVWDTMLYANRYVTPGVPGLLILAALGIDDLVRDHGRAPRGVVQALACVFVVVAIVSVGTPVSIQGLSATRADERLRLARAAIALTPVLVLPFLLAPLPIGRRLGRTLSLARVRSAVVAALMAASLTAINGHAVGLWIGHNAFYVDDDAWTTRYGLALRAATAEDASIAVTWAGAIPYFSHRPTIDLLGKSDRVIAGRERQPAAGFEPGHDKWDYRYSIGELRPDVVADLWHASDDDLRAIEGWGYVRLAPWVFARADSTRVDRVALGPAVCTILREDPFVLGSTTRSVANLHDIVARYCRD